VLLVVDVGNTQTVIGLVEGGEVEHHWRIATVRHRTGDEIAGLLQGFFSLAGMRFTEDVGEVGIASVVPRGIGLHDPRDAGRPRPSGE